MKKFLALFLSVLMLVSAIAFVAAAEDDTTPEETEEYTVTYDVNGNLSTETVAAGQTPSVHAIPQPYSDAEGRIYEFHAWISSVDGKSYSPYDMPVITSDVTFKAEFYVTYEPSEQPAVTFFSFLQGIFQNLTKIFAAATNNVKIWTKHLTEGSDFVKALFENVF